MEHGLEASLEDFRSFYAITEDEFSNHYDSKDHLMRKAICAANRRLLDNVTSLLDNIELDGPGALRKMVHELCRAHDHGFPEDLVSRAIAYYPKDHPVHEMAVDCKRLVVPMLEELCQQSYITNPSMAAKQLLLIAEGSSTLLHLFKSEETRDLWSTAIDHLIEAFPKRNAPARRPIHTSPEETKSEILETAAKLFHGEGYHVGIDRMIAESGVAKMTFYKYFPSKNELICEVISLAYRKIHSRMREITADQARTPLDQLQQGLEFLCESMSDPMIKGGLIPRAVVELNEGVGSPRNLAVALQRRIFRSVQAACAKAELKDSAFSRQMLMLVYGSFVLEGSLGKAASVAAAKAAVGEVMDRLQIPAPAGD